MFDSNKCSKPLFQDYLDCIAKFCAKFCSQNKSFLTTPNVQNKFRSLHETIDSTDEMRLMMKFYLCLYNFSEL